MWGCPAVSKAAVQLLVQAASSQDDDLFQVAAFEQFCHLPAYPACLAPLFTAVANMVSTVAADRQPSVKRLLLAQLGDLEAVWVDDELRDLLLGLPLPAMELLLSLANSR
jgi:hypothetical protein